MNRSESLLIKLKSNPFVLAPMAGITDTNFRQFMRAMGCGVVISELVSAHGIHYASPRTLRLLSFAEVERPVGLQIFGDSPEVLAQAARFVEQTGADFVDLNFGCPVPKVVKKGGGSAILKDLKMVEAVFREIKKTIQVPLTVKIRTGWDENSKNAIEVANIAYNEGLTWVAIHGRTRSAGYSGRADWDFIGEVKAQSKIPIIGNGDILSAAQAVDRLKNSGCDVVMIGRGALKNPWIFQESLDLWSKSAIEPVKKDFVGVFEALYKSFLSLDDEKITALQLKKFSAWYSSGYPQSAQFRKTIFQLHSVSEVMKAIFEYFRHLNFVEPSDTSGEAFLMGGHG